MDQNIQREAEKLETGENTHEMLELGKTWSQEVILISQSKRHNFSQVVQSKSIFHEMSKQDLSNNKELVDILHNAFDNVSPLIYLNSFQRNLLLSKMKFIHYHHKSKIYAADDNSETSAFLLLKGEVHIYNPDGSFEDFINNVSFFGYDGPIFQARSKTAVCNEDSFIGVIDEKTFLELIVPFSKYCMYLSRIIIYKDKTLDNLNSLKTYILSMTNKGPINLKHLTEKYLLINSCLHPGALRKDIDVNAWSYALNRLPVNIFETIACVMINVAPKILSTRDEVHKTLLQPVKTKARMRDTYRYIDGKNVIFVRELETDVLDFIANMCIHIVECTKMRKFISNPLILEKLYDAAEDFEKTVDVLKHETTLHFNHEEINVLRKTFGNQFSRKLINIMLHYQDYSITINKIPQNNLDSVEKWVQNLWSHAKKLLEINSSVDEIDDLVVDIIQGSKRTLIGCISPHLHANAEEILKWGEETKVELQTKVFNNEIDRLLAVAYHYYKAFPEKQKEREEVEAQHGIQIINETYGTGIGVLLVNVNKLDPKYVDPNLVHKAASKNHLILHIGYTFGSQSSSIIKPILMLFGSKARSMNIIGKAGGLAGNRTDILVANKMFYDKTHELCTINCGEIDKDELINDTKSGVNIGPMLTVAGTILQNNDLLHFYKHVMGCVGLEMEGYFFIKEIDNAIKHGLLRQDFITRCFYYASDLPLDPTQNLSMEDGNVSWDEGVGSMNAIMRFIFKKIFSA